MEELTPEQRMQLDALSEEYYRQYGVAIEFLKAEVGAGEEYTNAAARALVSPNGAWLELIDLPMEFSGMAGGAVEHHFITDEETLTLLNRLHDAMKNVTPENTRQFGLIVLYKRTGVANARDVFVYQHTLKQDDLLSRPLQIGRFREHLLPLVFRCRMDTDLEMEGVPFRRGSLFCLTQVGERNLLVWMPHEGEELHDLSNMPLHPVEH